MKSTTHATRQPDFRPGRFPKSARLSKRSEFAAVRESGRQAQGRLIKVGVLFFPESRDSARVGVITSRRVGNAVARNRTRRRLREIFRACGPEPGSGCWIVIVAKPPAAVAAFNDLREEWLRLAARLSIVRDSR